ncbi:MAG: hypothetical protein JXR69_02960 [Candidatus Delongbacteria bacterium]|nr:hypothetical protein [Candidatus Delongbacteria bacterium]
MTKEKLDKRSLMISVYSFGFQKNGIPANEHGDGGGFVFDCRFLLNPHNDPKLREFTGKDQPIIEFFSDYHPIDIFIDECYLMVERSAISYIESGYTNLQVSFGCTGGRHRSVYCAEKVTKKLSSKGFQVQIFHQEI